MQNGYNALRDVTPGAPEELSPDISFMDTAQASLSYKYGPIADAWNQARKYPIAPVDGFSARDNIPDEYLDWSSTLVSAVNQEHLDLKISQIDDRIELHKTLQNSGIIPTFAVEIFDPVNWMGVPFMKAGSISKSFLRSGTGVTSIVGMQEAIRYPFDPLATPAEVGMNLSMSFVMGGVLGGAVSIPQQRRLKAAADAKPELEAWYQAIQKRDSYTELQGKIKEQEITLGSTKEKLEELKASRLGSDLKNPEGRYLLKKIDIAERSLKVFNRQLELSQGDASIAPNIFTDSWIFKSVTTPMKRVLQNPNIPDSVKVKTLMIANDSGILLAMNRNGKKIGSSVWQNAKQFDGEWVMLQDDLQDLWGQSTGNGTVSALDYTYNRSGFESWLEGIDKKAIRGEAPANDIEAQVMNKINNFYEVWETRLTDTGEIGSKPALERVIALRETRIEKVKKNLETARSANHRRKLEGQLKRNLTEIQEAKASLDAIAEDSASKVLPPNETIFRPRYYDIPAILKNREQFEQILVDWFKVNPIIVRQDGAKFLRNRLPTDESSLRTRAKDATDQILGIKDITEPDIAFYGLGKSKHLRHRTLDIPNKLVLDFIQTNPRAVMQAYTQRTARRYEFSRQFNGLNIKDVLDDVYDDMKAAGSSSEEAWAAMKEMRHLHEAVVGGMYRNPDSWSHRYANTIRKLAQYNYLGQAYKSTITEPSKILMEHGIGPTMKGLFGILRDNKLKMGAKEARFGGEAVDNIMNNNSLRQIDEPVNNPFSGDFLDKAAHPFFLLNGLGPITKIMKDLDAMLRSHSLVDYSIRWTQGKATKMEQEYLLRYNIDLKIATEIANAPWERSSDGLYMANTEAWTNTIQFPATTAKVISGNTNTYVGKRYSPAFYNAKSNTIRIDEEYIKDVMYELRGWENPRVEGVTPIKEGIINSPDDYVAFIKMHEVMHSLNSAKSLGFDKRTKKGLADYENAINDLAVAEIEKQPRISPETVREFRSALSSGVLNTILMGTPADLPAISKGVVYIPMRVASQFGMKEDPKYTGYARIENGLLGLPFQFYSYSLAAMNKITAAHAHGQMKNQFIGIAASMGLGYMALQLKTPDWVEMDFEDQFARSFDYSGQAALLSDMMYTAMSTSLALGGPNLTGGLLEPRFPQGPSAIDAVTGLAGAGASTVADIGKGVADILSGNVGEGAAEIVDDLPFTGLFFIDGLTKSFQRMLRDMDEDQNAGYRRY